jgi:glucan biosynthesis protein C
MGYVSKYLITNTPFLKYANEAVLPFYILHQTVLLLIGYFVLQWTIPDPAKWPVIAVSSFALVWECMSSAYGGSMPCAFCSA